jgi:hypothetical protein
LAGDRPGARDRRDYIPFHTQWISAAGKNARAGCSTFEDDFFVEWAARN